MSTLDKLHDQAMEAAFFADLERRKGNDEQAAELFKKALALERQAIAEMTRPVEPTWSILHRSAGWLALDCNQPHQAERLACTALAGAPPSEIAEELRDLLEHSNFRRHLELKGVTLEQDEVQLSLSGQAVGLGLVDLAEFSKRVEDSSKLIHRIVERKTRKPFRERGPTAKSIKDQYPSFVSSPRAASFAVTLKFGQPNDQQLSFPEMSGIGEILDEFMDLMELVNDSKVSDIQKRISDPAYTRNFFGLTKKIAPDGERIRQVGFTVLRRGVERSVEITKPSSEISLAPEDPPSVETEPVEVQGILRYADATGGSSNRIKVIDKEQKAHTINVPEGMMSDIVRPMWDLFVSIRGVRKGNLIELQEISEARGD